MRSALLRSQRALSSVSGCWPLLVAWLLVVPNTMDAREFADSRKLQTVTSEELLALLIEREDENDGPVLIDTRGPSLYARDHIPGAINVHAARVSDGSANLEKYRDRGMILYSGNGASSRRMGQKLIEQGYRKVFSLEGTLRNWRFSGYPLEVFELPPSE